MRVRVRVGVRVRVLAHRVVQRAAGRVGHHEARRLLDARSVEPDHVRVAHARERAHLAAHGLGDGAQRRLARLALVAATLLLDRDAEPLGWKVGEGGWITFRVPVYRNGRKRRAGYRRREPPVGRWGEATAHLPTANVDVRLAAGADLVAVRKLGWLELPRLEQVRRTTHLLRVARQHGDWGCLSMATGR